MASTYLTVQRLKNLCQHVLAPGDPKPTKRQEWLELALKKGLLDSNDSAQHSKRTRADVAAKRSAGKTARQICREMSVSALLADVARELGLESSQDIRARLDEVVELMSRILVQRSLFVNTFLTDALDNRGAHLIAEGDRWYKEKQEAVARRKKQKQQAGPPSHKDEDSDNQDDSSDEAEELVHG
jgi:hypothetical protein